MYVTVECEEQKEAEMIEEELNYEKIPFRVKQIQNFSVNPKTDSMRTEMTWVYTFEYHDKLI